jgi:2-polyprenyl-6-methoxyphenol hydroxylase-like FAD-dependent oxidoreductase
MSRTDETEVLVVGAGPTGILTALILAEAGIRVKIIDKEYRTAAHSYACVLHPGTLQALSRLGLTEEICGLGRPIETMAFYEGQSRRAEISFAELSNFPYNYALVLPQSAFEDVLERQLAARGVKVLWNHRLRDLEFKQGSVSAAIDKLVQTAKGYIVADWDWTVQKRLETTADFVVGTDGHNSMVRSRLGIEYESLGKVEQFAVFEFETDADTDSEVRIAIDENTTNVLWPLPGNRCRWSFQLLKSTDLGDFPAKQRDRVRFAPAQADEPIRHAVERLAQKRAPWFKGTVKEVQWSTRIQFGRQLARQFGNNRTWLAGDAAHQTGPVAAQSMNVGLLEAVELANLLKDILRKGASRELLEQYGRNRRIEWEQLLGKGCLTSANAWVESYKARLIPCLPASGNDLAELFAHLTGELVAKH